MATSIAPVSLNPTPSTTLWGIVLLEHLDELATLAWYLVADGKLVEDTFSRTLTKLDTIPFEPSIPGADIQSGSRCTHRSGNCRSLGHAYRGSRRLFR
jgi:hypothetical protein